MLDLAIHNGMVVDGTGSPGFHASVLVKDNRIAIHRGDHSGLEAARAIDAQGKVVCPGFVDLHSHAGLTMLGEPRHDPKVRQGVTTELVGIDGISHAPYKSQEELQRAIWLDSGFNGYPPGSPDWLSVLDLYGKYDNAVSINVAIILGNAPVRIWSVGWNDRPATDSRDRRHALRYARGDGRREPGDSRRGSTTRPAPSQALTSLSPLPRSRRDTEVSITHIRAQHCGEYRPCSLPGKKRSTSGGVQASPFI